MTSTSTTAGLLPPRDWAVVKFCRATERSMIPTLLRFPCAPAKEAITQEKPKRRDPSHGALELPKLYDSPRLAKWNLKASRAKKAVLDCAPAFSRFRPNVDPRRLLRSVESALFM